MTDSALAVDLHDGARDLTLAPLATVSARNGLDPLAARLLELRDWLGDDLTELELGIDAVEGGVDEPHVGRQAAQHLLARPGKRIRPLCVMLASRLGGVGLTPVVRELAIACELVHAATLLHDDVIDEGTERRGAAAARMLYGNSASILAGDHLLIEALRRVEGAQREVPTGSLLLGLLDVISEMVAAEALQLERRGRFEPSRDSYLRIIKGKTAVLFRWGLEAGGHVAGLPAEQVAALGRAGVALGMAFQLVDDVLDLEGNPEDTGKDALADLREGKLTWPFILAAERDPRLAAAVRAAVAGEGGPTEADAAWIVSRVRESAALTDTRSFAVHRGETARAELRTLPAGRARDALEMVVDAAIMRSR